MSVQVIEATFNIQGYDVIGVDVKEVVKKTVKEAEFDYWNFIKKEDALDEVIKMKVDDFLINAGGNADILFTFAKSLCKTTEDKTEEDAIDEVINGIKQKLESGFREALPKADVMDIVEAYAYAHGIDVEEDEEYLDDPFGRIGATLKDFMDWVNGIQK